MSGPLSPTDVALIHANPTLLESLTALLERAGATVLPVLRPARGSEASSLGALIARYAPSVVVYDVEAIETGDLQRVRAMRQHDADGSRAWLLIAADGSALRSNSSDAHVLEVTTGRGRLVLCALVLKALRVRNGGSVVATLHVDAAAQIVAASPSVVGVLGYSPEELLGRNPFALVHPDERDEVLALLARLLAQPGSMHTGRYRGRHRDGSWRWTETVHYNLLADPLIGRFIIRFREISDPAAETG